VTLIYDRTKGPDGVTDADTVFVLGRFGDTGVSFTNFNMGDMIGVAIGARNLATGAVIVAVITTEDTEELRQQLNAWYGRKATLIEVKNG
jgi:hypothetical protein